MTGVRFIGSVRNFLWRTLPPTAYQHARYSCRNCSFFLPQTISARFHAATPEVHTFGSGDLNTRLHKANVLAPTRMCRTMTRTEATRAVDGTTTPRCIPLSSGAGMTGHCGFWNSGWAPTIQDLCPAWARMESLMHRCAAGERSFRAR